MNFLIIVIFKETTQVLHIISVTQIIIIMNYNYGQFEFLNSLYFFLYLLCITFYKVA